LRVIAMGAGDYYGPNANGDYFSEDELIKNHKTFEKFAHVYRHHDNKNPENSYGKPEVAWYNPDMKRVELIIKISNEKNRDIIYKLEAGEDIPVSMAAKVKYDVCSICEKKAASLSDHCGHLKYNMNKIAGDGRKVFAYNPSPLFFDISFVNVPADKIAYTLEKVASVHDSVIDITTSKKPSIIPFEKISLIKKLSEIEKQISGVIEADENDVEKTDEEEKTKDKMDLMSDGLPEDISDQKEYDKEDIIGYCKKHNISLEPEEFFDMCDIDDENLINKIKSLLPGGFERLLGLDENFMSEIFDKFDQPEEELEGMDEFRKEKSLSPHDVSKRIMIITIKGAKPKRKLIKSEKDVEKIADVVAIKLANLYNMFKIATCEDVDPFMLVLQNYYQFNK